MASRFYFMMHYQSLCVYTGCMISFIWSVQNWQIHRSRKNISGCQGHSEGNGEWLLKGKGFLLGKVKMLWKYLVVMVVQLWEYTSKTHWLVYLYVGKVYGIWNDISITLLKHCCCSVTKLCPTLCNPMDPRLVWPWDFPGKNNWVSWQSN